MSWSSGRKIWNWRGWTGSRTEDCVCVRTSRDSNVELVSHPHQVPRWKLRRAVPRPRIRFPAFCLLNAKMQLHLCFALSYTEQMCTNAFGKCLKRVSDGNYSWDFMRFLANPPCRCQSVETRTLSPMSLPFHHSHTGISIWFDSYQMRQIRKITK